MTADELKRIAAEMKELNRTGRHAAARARWPEGKPAPEREGVDLELAIATYKDKELRAFPRHELARQILAPYLAATTSADLVAVAGAVERRFYEVDLRPEHLHAALRLYQRGHQMDESAGWPEFGYPGINAAFIADQLAALAGEGPSQEAAAIRRTIIAQLSEPVREAASYFGLVTVAEAHFGLRDYRAAAPFLAEAAAAKPAPSGWQLETTGRQLAALARMHGGAAGVPEAAVDALCALFGTDANALCSALIGKLGLALSGGGFRASLFHLGVLTRLAELDLLRHVEVLSCVSGGSIIGALYYLELRRRLRGGFDGPLDYVELVSGVRDRFLAGVRADVRNRIFFDPIENYRILKGTRSRTEVAASLYERHFYAASAPGEKLWMRELGIGDVSENYRRRNKHPLLILNATTLNTGHSWQFTTRGKPRDPSGPPTLLDGWMGESPPIASEDVDVNDRFERRPYELFPAPARDVSIGTAVAASACVPGIFEPIEIAGAYTGHRVRLVDGGVHDNQGVRALLEQDCTAIIVSDASGQMGFEGRAPSGAMGALFRSDAIFQARLREAQYMDLQSRRRGNLLRFFGFMHLKQDFKPRTISPDAPGDLQEPVDDELPYKLSHALQLRLSALRTDLDEFSEAECELLMASGHAIAGANIDPVQLGAPPPPPPPSSREPTLALQGSGLLAKPGDALLRHLEIGASTFGKSLQAAPWLKRGVQLAGLLAAGAAVWWLWAHRGDRPLMHLTIGGLVTAVVVLLLKRAVPVAAPFVDAVRGDLPILAPLRRAMLAVGLAVTMRGASWLVRRTFLRQGRLDRLL